ncbi:hypothetical protein [Rubripirellula reticaptiva]|uniref:Secreted protein n=1 Tax=Rubripirellula reticaptiva TaxID=2528013 RepID=A0A5C6EMX7_9BACT|nr:hypothetical protein [Rubripirellula reticaptiva]TWU49760.1 hypothetical protein Poly59_43850 [Rubripirellula reticaptiva]
MGTQSIRNVLAMLLLLAALDSSSVLGQSQVKSGGWSPDRWDDDFQRDGGGDDDATDMAAKQIMWPAPVRIAQLPGSDPPIRQTQYAQYEVAPFDEPSSAAVIAIEMSQTLAGDLLPVPLPAHQVIAAPRPKPRSASHGGAGARIGHDGGGLHGELHDDLASHHDAERRSFTNPLPPGYRLHHHIQAPTATIPNAVRRETWKTPYSYGYFGASGTRSWSRHTSYRDNKTEWRLH